MGNAARWLAIFATAALTGCAGQMSKDKMASYIGQPASAVIEKIGYPTAEQTAAGAKVYIWSTSRLVEGTSLGCKIKAIVDAQGVVTSWDFEGTDRGCAAYASKLDQY